MSRIRGIPIYGHWIEGFFRFDEIKFRSGVRTNNFSVKTAPITDVARGLFAANIGLGQGDVENDAVLIIIDEHSLNLLAHAGGFALFPKLLP